MTLWTPWLEVTITGFVYLSAIFLFLLYLLKVHDLTFLESLRPYAPYIAVVLLFSSYVCGLVAHLALAKILAFCFPEFKYFNPKRIIQAHVRAPEYLSNSIGISYANFVLLRHLAIATWLLGNALILWLDPRKYSRQQTVLSLTCFFIAAMFVLTYFAERPDFIQLRELIRFYAP